MTQGELNISVCFSYVTCVGRRHEPPIIILNKLGAHGTRCKTILNVMVLFWSSDESLYNMTRRDLNYLMKLPIWPANDMLALRITTQRQVRRLAGGCPP